MLLVSRARFSTCSFLEGPPAKIVVAGFNARGNEFSTLGSIPFEWHLQAADGAVSADRRPLRIVSFTDSHYLAPPGIAELEAQKKRGAELLLEGIQTGKALVRARVADSEEFKVRLMSKFNKNYNYANFKGVPACTTEIFVVQRAVLVPPEDLYVPVGAVVDYSVVILKQSGTAPVALPSPQYRLDVTAPDIADWDAENSRLIARQVGETELKLIDTS